MLYKSSLILLILTFGQLILAQVPITGKCPQVKGMSEFDLGRYVGTWYEYARYPFIFETGLKCVYAEYESRSDGTVSVMNVGTNQLNNANGIKGYAKVLGPGRLGVVFYPGQSTDRENYVVLGTDYGKYAVVFSCTELGPLLHTEVVWILTRDREPSEDTIAAAKKVIDDNNLSQTYLSNTVQDDCPSPGVQVVVDPTAT